MSSYPAYYINLAKAVARRDFMEAQFHRLGLAAERVDAVPTADIDPALLARASDPRHYFWLTPGELGCNLSHLEALSRFQQTGAPYGLVFEDDAVISGRLPELLAALPTLALPVDLVKIETFNIPIWLEPAPIGRIGAFALRRARGWSAGAAGYIVSQRGAARILARDDLHRMVIDEAFFNPFRPLGRRLAVYYTEPALVIQEDRLPGADSALASNLNQYRSIRDEREAQLGWRQGLRRAGRFVDRDMIMASMKLYHRLIRHTRKELLTFSG
jgi:glycosyl transferase family 25